MALQALPTRLLHRFHSIHPRPFSLCHRCLSSTTASSSLPLRSRLQADLKTAMRAKDSTRLSVIRSLLADITNSSKTAHPIDSDIKLLTLVRKKISAAQQAAVEFANARREDLASREREQMAVLEDYAGAVDRLGEGEVRRVVRQVIDEILKDGQKAHVGEVVKRAFKPGGAFDGQPVEKGEVVKVIKESMPG